MIPNNWVLQVSGVTGSALSFASSASWSQKIVRVSCQINVGSGSAHGVFRLEGSNDASYGRPGDKVGTFTPTNWNIIGSSTIVACSVSATASTRLLLMPSTEICYEYIRIVFVDDTDGTAVGAFSVRAKSLGL